MEIRHHIDKVSQHPFVAERPVVKEFIKFSIVGVLNTFVDILFFSFFLYVFQWHYLTANIVAVAAASTNSYILNRRWTWRSTDPRWHQQVAKFMTIVIIGFFLNEGLLFLFVERGGLAPLIAKLLAVGVVLVVNFTANRYWTFKSN